MLLKSLCKPLLIWLAQKACGKGPKAEASAVYECYQKTDEDSPDIDICILADISTSNSANTNRLKSEALGGSNPYEGIPFVTKDAFFKRLAHFRNAPRFVNLKDDPLNFNDYFKSRAKIVTEHLNAKCRSMGY